MADKTPAPPPDIEWEDGTVGLPPPDIEWEDSPAVVSSESNPGPAPAAPKPPPPARDPGLARTVGRGLLQGFFKQGADEAVGGIAGAATDVGPGARYRMPDGTTRPVETGGDLYRAVRDGERETERGAREHRPVASFLSNMAGDIASDAALGALGVPVASTPYQVAAGALSGLLGSDSELSTNTVKPEAVRGAAGSTALGAGLGYAMPKVGTAIAQRLPGALARLRAGLESNALENTKKALTSGSKQLANKMPVSDAAAREALDSGAVPLFGTATGAAKRLEDLAETRGALYADIVERLERAGVTGPNVRALADELLARAKKLDLTETDSAIPSEYRRVSDDIINKSVLAETQGIAPINRLALSQAESIKQSLQKRAKYGKREDVPLNEARKEIASMVRQANEDAIEAAGSAANPSMELAVLSESFLPVKQQLARTLEARSAAQVGADKAAHRMSGGAADVNLFDVANAANATGTQGIPALALAMAGRAWKERRPSTLANIYDVGAEAAGNLSRAARTDAGQSAVANYLVPASARQVAGSGTVERALAEYLMRRQQSGSGN